MREQTGRQSLILCGAPEDGLLSKIGRAALSVKPSSYIALHQGGLPCRLHCCKRGGLLHRRCALTPPKRSGLFSVALSIRHCCLSEFAIPLECLSGTLLCDVRTFLRRSPRSAGDCHCAISMNKFIVRIKKPPNKKAAQQKSRPTKKPPLYKTAFENNFEP
jgi:hypothetical protein